MDTPDSGIGRIDYETWGQQDLAAVHIWIPALEPKPKEGWLFNDGAVHTTVTWFWGFDLKVLAEMYWLEYKGSRYNEAYEAYKRDPSKGPPSFRNKPGDPPVVVHAQTEDGVVHIFDVSEEWHVETVAKERITQ